MSRFTFSQFAKQYFNLSFDLYRVNIVCNIGFLSSEVFVLEAMTINHGKLLDEWLLPFDKKHIDSTKQQL